MVDDNNLIKGNIYFLISFFDNDLTIPDIEIYIYIGKNVLPSDKESEGNSWYFQDPETYLQKGAFIESQEKSDFDILRADLDTLETIYDLEGVTLELSDIQNK
jgi:hypothetical protein